MITQGWVWTSLTHRLLLVVGLLHEDVLHELGVVKAWGEAHDAVLEQQCGGDVLCQVKVVGFLTTGSNLAPAFDAAHFILQDGSLEHTWRMHVKE